MKNRLRNRALFFLLPGLIGMIGLYLLPYLLTYYYAFTDSNGGFVGFEHYQQVMGSSSFLTALGNTTVYMLICIPLNMIVPFLLAQVLHKRKRSKLFSLAFMLPLVIPSGTTVYFWKVLFANHGLVNKLLAALGMETANFLQSESALFVVLLVFLFKNVGFNMVLFLAGLEYIPKEYYETAMLEGCSKWYTMRRITLVYLAPTTFIALLMSTINSFKAFREIYLLFGDYPHASIYMLQHYMNNLFSQAALQKLSAASTLLSLLIVIVVSILFTAQKRLSENL